MPRVIAEGESLFTIIAEPRNRQVSGRMKSNYFKYDNCSEKADMSSDQSRHRSVDDRTLKEVWLLLVLCAERSQENKGRVWDERTDLDTEGQIG